MLIDLPFTAPWLGFAINLFAISTVVFFETLVNLRLYQNRQCLFSDEPNICKSNEAIQILSKQEAK